MKCEICHKREAKTTLPGKDEDHELYVCEKCAHAAEEKKQRSRGVTVETEEDEGKEPTIGEVKGAIHGFMSAMESVMNDIEHDIDQEDQKRKGKFKDFPIQRVDPRYRIGRCLHLEGLHLTGELDNLFDELDKLDMRLVGINADGVRDAANAFRIQYRGGVGEARKVVEDILAHEKDARERLFGELSRLFGDTLCRALAILKNARLLSPTEQFDLLSSVRIAAYEKMLLGIDLEGVEEIMNDIDFKDGSVNDTVEERDQRDAERADLMNRRFEHVVLSKEAAERFL